MTTIASPPKVSFDAVLEHFHTRAKVAKAFSVTRAAVQQWAEKGEIPRLRAMQFAALVDNLDAAVNEGNTHCAHAACKESQ